MAYKPISLPPEDSQFLSTREFGVEEICRIFGFLRIWFKI